MDVSSLSVSGTVGRSGGASVHNVGLYTYTHYTT